MLRKLEKELREIGKAIAAVRAEIQALSQKDPVPQEQVRELEAKLKELTERFYRLNPKSQF